MRLSVILIFSLFLAFPLNDDSTISMAKGDEGIVPVLVKTEVGEIVVNIDTQNAPKTSENFLKYVDGGHYNGGSFHRTVHMKNQPDNEIKIEVIQGATARNKGKGFGELKLERTSVTGLKHLNGTISMARSGPDTAKSGFFFCINNQPELDFGGKRNPDGQGFAAFGQVTKGMDIVKKIQMSKAKGQNLTPSIKILSVERIKK
ncbi:MAG: peptidylprolyl isomerase [Pirellulaceae bacterium]|nr:peptidylprolyl isomerase [Pirellulaceae bacterium]